MDGEIANSAVSPKSWPARHWKLLAFLCVLVLTALCATFVFSILSLMRSSTPVQMALARAAASQALAAKIGSPLKSGWYLTGSFQVNENSGSADLSIPLSGPRGSGTLYLEAEKHAGLWTMELLKFAPKGSDDRLDLLQAQSGSTSTDQ